MVQIFQLVLSYRSLIFLMASAHAAQVNLVKDSSDNSLYDVIVNQYTEDKPRFFEFLMDIGVRMGNRGQYRKSQASDLDEKK